jgi:hypothetical protein
MSSHAERPRQDHLYDGNDACAGGAALLRAAQALGMPMDNTGGPAGWPRPQIEGRPVPWLTPCAGDSVAWADVLEHRLVQCQTDWLCQVCGERLSTTAWVVLERSDIVVSGAAMHRRCLALAQRWCPRLSDNREHYEVAEISRDELGPVDHGH